MASLALPITFRGNAGKFVTRIALYVLAIGFLVSFVLAGGSWIPFLGSSLAVVSPFLLALYFVIARWDRFALDDDRREILRPLRKAIPYDDIESFETTSDMGVMRVVARTEATRGGVLAVCLDRKEGSRLNRALSARWLEKPLAHRQASTRALLIATASLLLVTYLAGLFYLHRKFPVVAAACRPGDWVQRVEAVPQGRRYEVEGVAFVLPEGFRLQRESSPEIGFRFARETTDRILVRAESLQDLLRRHGEAGGPTSGLLERRLVLRAFGITNSYELFRMTYCARLGLIPLLLKALLLSGNRQAGTEPALYHAEQSGWRALVAVEQDEGQGRAQIRLRADGPATDLYFLIQTSGGEAQQLAAEVLRGVGAAGR